MTRVWYIDQPWRFRFRLPVVDLAVANQEGGTELGCLIGDLNRFCCDDGGHIAFCGKFQTVGGDLRVARPEIDFPLEVDLLGVRVSTSNGLPPTPAVHC